MEKPLVSIIIPVYNVERYIHRCVNSIISQTYKNLEIILVDDESPDNCPQICDSYAEKDKRIVVLHKANGGTSSARNLGLEHMTGEYVTFVDSDDFLQPTMVEKLYILCKKHNCLMAQCNYVEGYNSHFRKSTNFVITEYNDNSIFDKRTLKVVVWAKLYHKDLFNGISFKENKRYEDEFITYRLAYKANNVIVTTEKLYYYFVNNSGKMQTAKSTVNLEFIEAYEERISYFSTKKEDRLIELSIKEFVIRLMLYYMHAVQINYDSNKTSNLLVLYNKKYAQLTNSKYVSLNEKILFEVFRAFPRFTSLIVNRINKR